MPVKLESDERDIVSASQMKDGDLAVIAYWDRDGGKGDRRLNSNSIGYVIQRYEDRLIPIGRDCGQAWTTALSVTPCSCYVRILKAGEKIVVQ